MPQLIPIRGLRYTPAAGDPSTLLAPPYDVISSEAEARLRASSPYNAVHLELAERSEGGYGAVASILERWIVEGILARDEAPMLYVYEQRFEASGVARVRRALFAGIEAQPWEERAVLPHEYTMSGPRADRLSLLEATRTQFSPTFMLARDRAGQLARFLASITNERPPDLVAEQPAGEEHRLWAVQAGRYEMRQLAPLLAESFYIADGHHRYETAVAYKQRLLELGAELPRDHPARFVLAAIVSAADPGLVVLPTHRLVPRRPPAGWEAVLSATFAISQIKPIGDAHAVAHELDTLATDHPPGAIVALGLQHDQVHILQPRPAAIEALVPPGHSLEWLSLPPNLLRYGVLEPLWGISDADLTAGAVEYTHDTGEAVVEAGAGKVAFIIGEVPVQRVLSLSDRGERLPQKSTYFIPKLATGLVFHCLEP